MFSPLPTHWCTAVVISRTKTSVTMLKYKNVNLKKNLCMLRKNLRFATVFLQQLTVKTFLAKLY